MSEETSAIEEFEGSTNTLERAKWLAALVDYAMPPVVGMHSTRPDGNGGIAVVIESHNTDYQCVTVLWQVGQAFKIESGLYEDETPVQKRRATVKARRGLEGDMAGVAAAIGLHLRAYSEGSLHNAFMDGDLELLARRL